MNGDGVMSDADMEANKEGIMEMLDSDNNYNGQFRKHESTPFVPPTSSTHSLKISPERFREIFGHD